MAQLDLFDRPAVPLNSSVDPIDRPRLRKQCWTLLARLRDGPATNVELSGIALRFGGRLHELKKAGVIRGWHKTRIGPGLIEYRLIEGTPKQILSRDSAES